MLEHVGEDNILSSAIPQNRWRHYVVTAISRGILRTGSELHQALTQIGTGLFSPSEPGRYRDLLDSLINFGDHYQVLADYRSYVDCGIRWMSCIVIRKSGR